MQQLSKIPYKGMFNICLYDENGQLVFIAECITEFVVFTGEEVSKKTLHCARNKIRQATVRRGAVVVNGVKLTIRLVKS